MTKKTTRLILKRKGLVTSSLDKVSREIFRRYSGAITDLIGSSPGVYALYDGPNLYYVGKATDLRRRVRHHLRDRHLASWTHFSLYLVRKEEQIDEIESLIVRIANPEGNRAIPKGKERGGLRKRLRILVKQKQQEEIELLFGEKKKERRIRVSKSHPKTPRGLVSKRTHLYRTYKGKEYKAILTPAGTIVLRKKHYKTPTAAAKAIVDRKSVNGWAFWYIKDKNGEWVRLCDYKR